MVALPPVPLLLCGVDRSRLCGRVGVELRWGHALAKGLRAAVDKGSYHLYNTGGWCCVSHPGGARFLAGTKGVVRVPVDYSALDDVTLIGLVAHARPEALSELYERYSRLVFSLAVNSVGDPGTAEEITQDVFVRVWEGARLYKPDRGKVSTWLTSIARHRAIDQLRRRGSRPDRYSMTWAEVPPEAMPTGDNPREVTQLAMEQERVRAAIAQLPDEQRQVLALAYFQGYTQRQIAEILDHPLGTVKTRIRLAMQKLRQTLDVDEFNAR